MAINISQNSVKYKNSNNDWVGLNNVLDGVKELPTVTAGDDGKVLKVINGNWELGEVEVSGGGVSADHKHSFLSGWSDTRNDATTPNDYNGKFKITGLKVPAAIGSPDDSRYHSLIGFRGWSDSSGGNAHELAFTGNGNIYHRNGIDVDWTTWRQVLDSENYTQYAAAKSHGIHVLDKSFDTNIATKFRTQTYGSSGNGAYVSAIRTESAVKGFNQYGAGIAFGRHDTSGYISVRHDSAKVYIGGGNGDTLNWYKELAFSDHTHTTLPIEEINTQANQYTNHCVLFGKNGRDKVEIYEYGGTLNLYKSANGTNTLILGVSPSGFTYNGNTVLTSGNWSSYAAAASHNHSAGNITSGTLGVARGGTGATTFTSGAALIGNGTGAVTTRAITNMTSKSYINYNANLMTTNTLAHWNGAFNASNTSNLTYCNRGAFGTIVTKATTDYLSSTGGAVNGRITSLKGTYTSTASNRFGNQALEIRENGHVGSAQSDIGYAPGIGFHWSGRAAASLLLHHDGAFRFMNQAYTDFSPIMVGTLYLGGAPYGQIYADSSYQLYINPRGSGAVHIGYDNRCVVPPTGSAGIRPSIGSSLADNGYSCGHNSYRWSVVYATSTAISTSDRNKKKDFRTFDSDENYEKLFFDLKPTVFKFKDGTSNRDHFGFISQDVEESLYKFGFNDKSFAGFCRDIHVDENENPILDENGKEQWLYSLRYEEFISLNTYMIQKSYGEIDAVRTENEDLKARIEKLEKIIEGLCA